MLNLEVKTNKLNLNPSEKRVFGRSLGEVIATYYEDEANLKAFEKEEEILKKEVKRLEAKRDSNRKRQKS